MDTRKTIFSQALSYTEFAFDNLRQDRDQMPVGDQVNVRVDVTNTGDCAGDEVVQLYVRHPDATVPRPIQELKGFKRISLEPGESKTVAFTLDTALLGYYDETMRYAVVPGAVEVMVGNSSKHLPLSGQFEIVGQVTDVKDKVFSSQVWVEEIV